MEIKDKFEDLKKEYLKTLSDIEKMPSSSINDISKIIYNQVMQLGNMTLETWLKEKIGKEDPQKKTKNKKH